MSPYANRYTTTVVCRARELAGSGWRVSHIPAVLERECGVRPSRQTVSAWVNPHRQQMKRTGERKRGRERNMAWKVDRMRELRARSVSFRAIGQVAAVMWGTELTEWQVRRLLGARS